jgi:hypothetical protein
MFGLFGFWSKVSEFKNPFSSELEYTQELAKASIKNMILTKNLEYHFNFLRAIYVKNYS